MKEKILEAVWFFLKVWLSLVFLFLLTVCNLFVFVGCPQQAFSMGKELTLEEKLKEAKKLEEEKCLVLSVEALLEEKSYLDASLLAKENCE